MDTLNSRNLQFMYRNLSMCTYRRCDARRGGSVGPIRSAGKREAGVERCREGVATSDDNLSKSDSRWDITGSCSSDHRLERINA